MEKKVRLRYAPSPTGPQHMGGIRTALFSYLYAKRHGGDFILRSEDTDQTRFVPGAEEYIIESLAWCGIKVDEGVIAGGPYAPYRQSERKELGIYKKYAKQLIASGHAYYAFDTPAELDEMRARLEAAKVIAPQYNSTVRMNMKNSLTLSEDEVNAKLAANEPYVVRLKVPRNEEIRFSDIIRGWVVVNSSTIDDKVLLKSDGMPTYHLAHIVDDIEMKITHAVRGEEWLPSAPAHILVYRYLGLENEMPLYAHLPLLLSPDGKGKLSKRDGDRLGFPTFPLNWTDPKTGETSSGYREQGYFPEAFVNMLALMGWNPGDNTEIMNLEELTSKFSFEKVSKSGAKFDPKKAVWFNQQYLRMQTNEALALIFEKQLSQHNITAPHEFVIAVCNLIKEKVNFPQEFWSIGSYYFIAPTEFDQTVIAKRWNTTTKDYLQALAVAYQALLVFDATSTEQTFKDVAEAQGLKTSDVQQMLRVATTGAGGGPSLFETFNLLGKTEIVNRINTACATFALTQ
ncbi:MAG: glutamate--tRNA ligase [Bacteroidia bacterium]|nr:glutamate--tRNA ligase [Bacteroidia bacterium]